MTWLTGVFDNFLGLPLTDRVITRPWMTSQWWITMCCNAQSDHYKVVFTYYIWYPVSWKVCENSTECILLSQVMKNNSFRVWLARHTFYMPLSSQRIYNGQKSSTKLALPHHNTWYSGPGSWTRYSRRFRIYVSHGSFAFHTCFIMRIRVPNSPVSGS